jgi:hypothetical protein
MTPREKALEIVRSWTGAAIRGDTDDVKNADDRRTYQEAVLKELKDVHNMLSDKANFDREF